MYPSWSVIDKNINKNAKFGQTTKYFSVLILIYAVALIYLFKRSSLERFKINLINNKKSYYLILAIYSPFILTALLFLFNFQYL